MATMSPEIKQVVENIERVVAELRDRAGELERFAVAIEADVSLVESPGIGEWYYLAQNTTRALHDAIRPVSILHTIQLVNRYAFDVAHATEPEVK